MMIIWMLNGCVIVVVGVVKMEFELVEFVKALLDVYVGEGSVASVVV